MYQEFEGHPLRKDYPVNKRQPLVPERDPIDEPWPAQEALAWRTSGPTAPDRYETRGDDEIMEIQMGPSHPASHGTIKFNLKLDGETIVDFDVEVGYLHRGFEKMCEQGTWTTASRTPTG